MADIGTELDKKKEVNTDLALAFVARRESILNRWIKNDQETLEEYEGYVKEHAGPEAPEAQRTSIISVRDEKFANLERTRGLLQSLPEVRKLITEDRNSFLIDLFSSFEKEERRLEKGR